MKQTAKRTLSILLCLTLLLGAAVPAFAALSVVKDEEKEAWVTFFNDSVNPLKTETPRAKVKFNNFVPAEGLTMSSDEGVDPVDAELRKYLIPRLMHEKNEVALLICLDVYGRIITTEELNRGVVNEVELNVRKIVELALKHRASSVILAHNHPDGIAIPSYDDELATRRVKEALELLNITLRDHLVISGDDYISFADSGYLRRY